MKRAVAASLLPGGERMRFFSSLELSTGDGSTHVLATEPVRKTRPFAARWKTSA